MSMSTTINLAVGDRLRREARYGDNRSGASVSLLRTIDGWKLFVQEHPQRSQAGDSLRPWNRFVFGDQDAAVVYAEVWIAEIVERMKEDAQWYCLPASVAKVTVLPWVTVTMPELPELPELRAPVS